LKYVSLTSYEQPTDLFQASSFLQPSKTSTLLFDVGTQDFDECAANASEYKHICLDGWYARFCKLSFLNLIHSGIRSLATLASASMGTFWVPISKAAIHSLLISVLRKLLGWVFLKFIYSFIYFPFSGCGILFLPLVVGLVLFSLFALASIIGFFV
jgi:hypothetical protein